MLILRKSRAILKVHNDPISIITAKKVHLRYYILYIYYITHKQSFDILCSFTTYLSFAELQLYVGVYVGLDLVLGLCTYM